MNSNAKKVLIAEDDGFIAEVYSTKLTFEGFNVVVAVDGEEAIEKIQKENPDIVLLDIMMPKKDGYEVLEEIRQIKEFKKTPIVVLTNVGEKDSIDKAMQLGATDYMVKSGFTPEEVVDKIKEVLK